MRHWNAIGRRDNAERHDRTGPSRAIGRGAVPPVVDLAVVVLLYAARRDRDEPRPDADNRQAVLLDPVLWRPANDLAPAERGPCRERKAHPAADAPYVLEADLPKTQHRQASERAQDLPPIGCAGCGPYGPIRAAAPTSPTTRCAGASSTWSPIWTGSPVRFWPGASPTRRRRTSASKR